MRYLPKSNVLPYCLAKVQFKANREFILNSISEGNTLKYIYDYLLQKKLISMKYNTFWKYSTELKRANDPLRLLH
jgi:hypothetical protein